MKKDLKKDFLFRFGEQLQKVRESKGLSQRELSLNCSIDHSNLSKIERGEKNITLLTIFELASALDVKPRRLLDFE